MHMKNPLNFMFLCVAILTLFAGVVSSTPIAHAQGEADFFNPSQGGTADFNNPSSGRIPNPLISDATSITDFLKIVLQNVVIPLGVVVIVLLVMYSGYLFVTAQGNDKKIGDAKKTLLYVLIGAAILLGATVIAEVIQATLCQISPAACGSTPPLR